jgi:glucokinase
MILAGDIGGTKTILALYEHGAEGAIHRVARRRFQSADYDGLEAVIEEFLAERSATIRGAAFGVAGPVDANRVRATNLPWVVDGAALSRRLGGARVLVLNDLEAAGYGLERLAPDDLATLQAGRPAEEANRAILAPGTGLGEAILFRVGPRLVVSATEGGHADFAPRNDAEIELLRHLLRRETRVSFETVLSGGGFLLLHEFLDASVRHAGFDDPEHDAAPEITSRAAEGSCDVCRRATAMWIEICGAEAGNLALKALARGGVYLAGGILTKILPLVGEGFLRAFRQKSKPAFEELLAAVPVHVVRNEDLPLVGAAARAAAALAP